MGRTRMHAGRDPEKGSACPEGVQHWPRKRSRSRLRPTSIPKTSSHDGTRQTPPFLSTINSNDRYFHHASSSSSLFSWFIYRKFGKVVAELLMLRDVREEVTDGSLFFLFWEWDGSGEWGECSCPFFCILIGFMIVGFYCFRRLEWRG